MRKSKLGLIWACTILMAILATSVVVQALSPTNRFTISSGVYPGAPSYTVYREGSVYYAKDAYGAMLSGFLSGSTNGTTISQATIDQTFANGGGNIYFKAGTYGNDGEYVTLKSQVHLWGEGSTFEPYGKLSAMSPPFIAPTRFKFRIAMYNVINAGVHYISLVPDAFRSGEAGILGKPIHYCIFERVGIAGYATGIFISTFNQTNSYSSLNQILYPVIYNCSIGIMLTKDGAGHKTEATQIIGGGLYGGYAGDSNKKMTHGVWMEYADYTTISDMIIVHATVGYQVGDGPTRISNPTYEDVPTRTSISTGVDCLISPVDSDYESWGQAYKTSGEWVAHGLAGIPDYVLISPIGNVNVWLMAVNATHFQVGVSAGSVSFDWHAKYIP